MYENESNNFYSLFNNPIFLSVMLSWFAAQFTKVIINIFKEKTNSSKNLFTILIWTTGGMPSSHSAAVTALTTAIGFKEGIGTSVFIAVLFISLIVIRDALGVRRATGSQARVINYMGKILYEQLKVQFKPVKEVNGHTVPEVAVGIILGFFIAVAVCNL